MPTTSNICTYATIKRLLRAKLDHYHLIKELPLDVAPSRQALPEAIERDEASAS